MAKLCKIFQCPMSPISLKESSFPQFLFYNKNVVIIGKSGELQENDYSDLCALCDVVVRPNVSILDDDTVAIDSVAASNSTTRTDVVYHHGGRIGAKVEGVYKKTETISETHGIGSKMVKAYKTAGVKAVGVMPHRSSSANELAKFGMPSFVANKTDKLYTTGVHAVLDIILYQPSRLYIIGMDAMMGDNPTYTNLDRKQSGVSKETMQAHAQRKKRGSHDLMNDLAALHQVYTKNPDVVVPSEHLRRTWQRHLGTSAVSLDIDSVLKNSIDADVQAISLGRHEHVASRFYFFDEQQDANKCAFVTACNSQYFDGVVKLFKSMQKVKSKYPLISICLDTTTDEQKQHLIELGIEVVEMELASIYNPYMPKWTEAFVKLELWNMTAFDRLCWVDSDIIMLQNCDELLSINVAEDGLACALDFEIFPSRDTVNTQFTMIQSGLFVLKPSMATYDKFKSLLGTVSTADGGDQGFLTSVLALDNFTNTKFISSKYNYLKRGLKRHKEFDLNKIKCLHFVGQPKPWRGAEKGYESLQQIWDDI